MNSDFFKEEVREGFCISAEMKKVWAVEMKVLSFVISVCKKYDIPYFADYGTLLGTVRHKGFIPWDDDIDICLKRSDYMRLIEAFKKENNTDYVYNGFYFSDTSGQPFMSVSDYTGVPIPASCRKSSLDVRMLQESIFIRLIMCREIQNLPDFSLICMLHCTILR